MIVLSNDMTKHGRFKAQNIMRVDEEGKQMPKIIGRLCRRNDRVWVESRDGVQLEEPDIEKIQCLMREF